MKYSKNIIIKSAAGILTSVALFSVLSSAVAKDAEIGDVIFDGAKLYQNTDTKSDVLFELPIDTDVEVIAETDNNWYRVMYGTTVGYMLQSNVLLNTTGSRTAYVTDDGVNLRGGPSQSSYIIEKLGAGSPVNIKALIGDWYFVTAGDKSGYVNYAYLMVAKATSASLEKLLKFGMEGAEVKKLQTELNNRGFLTANDITGLYGSKTRNAVKEFQVAAGIPGADGVAGDVTLAALYDPKNTVTHENAFFNKVKGTVELLDWFKGGSDWIYRYSYFIVTDVRSGLSFNARRFGGWYHADCEPVTASDTAIIKQFSGSWSWNRRPIWVTFNGRTVAASMHTMPHMANPTRSNNFDGHFCIHLLNSKVHETSRPCPRHQACVREAYNAGKAKK